MEIKLSNELMLENIEINNQHKKLFEVANDLINKRKDFKETLNFLQAYVIEHFLYEEYFQKLYKYPNYKFHKDFHWHFIDKLDELAGKYEKCEYTLEELNQDMIKLMNNWFRDHILNEDKKMLDFLIANGADFNDYKLNIKWNNSLETGIEEIDVQHKEIFDRTQKMFNKVSDAYNKDVVMELIDFLSDYINTHFKTEEKLHNSTEYPDLISHKVMHSKFTRDIMLIRMKVKSGNINSSTIVSLCSLINNWFVEHISNEDIKFAEYFKNKLN